MYSEGQLCVYVMYMCIYVFLYSYMYMCKYVYAMISVYSYVYIYIHIPVESRHICAHPRSLTCPPPQHISQDVVHVSCITPTEFCYLPTKTEPHSQRSNSLFLVPASSLWSVTDNLSLSLGSLGGVDVLGALIGRKDSPSDWAALLLPIRLTNLS